MRDPGKLSCSLCFWLPWSVLLWTKTQSQEQVCRDVLSNASANDSWPLKNIPAPAAFVLDWWEMANGKDEMIPPGAFNDIDAKNENVGMEGNVIM